VKKAKREKAEKEAVAEAEREDTRVAAVRVFVTNILLFVPIFRSSS
jgi:hypothetical protein